MDLQNYSIPVPKEMMKFVQTDNDEKLLIQRALLLYPFVQNLTISHGKAAEILGIKKLDLIDLYENLGIPYFNFSIDEVQSDLENCREFLLKKEMAK